MDKEPKVRSEKGKGKGKKYKNIYSRQHVENSINTITNSIKKEKNKKK